MRPDPPDLRPLLNPRSIAVVGASPTARVGANMVLNLVQIGYPGRIYPVNPRYAEILRDSSLRLAPLTAADAESMIDDLRGRAVLDGYRGRPAVSRRAIVDVLLALSRLALSRFGLGEGHRIEQLDTNPLIVSESSAVAVDALVVLRDAENAPPNPLS